MLKTLLASASLSVLTLATPVLAQSTGYSSAWLVRIGDTSAISAQSNGGAGVLIALVDTGVVTSNPEISGRVSSLSACAAVTFACSNGFVDDNGHGTATASIAAGQYNANDLMSGVAPAAGILSEKVLDASGSGTDADVANGITRAANAGAKVINLSLTYVPTAAVVTAMNYAAGKGAVIVWAGGNASSNLNGGYYTEGLTAATLSHLVFVGSLAANNFVSSFSNRPGTGAAVAGWTRASYSSLWLMAPGENIVAPGIQYGATANAYWSGTSMAAPMVAGSIALLEATWPVLSRNGTATAVLFDTATDLGAPGVDNIFGQGELNLTKAFQPIGSLSVTGVNGKSIPVSQVTGALITGGALGQLSSIRSSLSNYTAFDTFQRNFNVNLSNLITSTTGYSTAIATQVSAPVSTGMTHFAGGGTLVMAASDFSFGGGLADDEARSQASRTIGPRDAGVFYLAMTDSKGTLGAVGRGLGSSASFANALWGAGSTASYQAQSLGVSSALMNLAQGGYFGSFGANLGGRSRLAVSFTQSLSADDMNIAQNGLRTSASAVEAGLSLTLTPRWSTGFTVSSLSERNALLGSVYSQSGPLSLGDSHRSASIGVSSSLDLGQGRSLLVDATVSRTGGAFGSGVIGQVSSLTSRGYGVSLLQADAFSLGDRLTLSFRKPLRVVAGWADLAQTTVDSDGYPTTTFSRFSLKPDGDETDLSLGYATILRGQVDVSTGLDYRADAENVKGLNDVSMRLAATWRF
ncbi:MAG TPA: S8 family serine peptidase [Caulobacteraceae bacterium]|jgi:hypothetical protein